MSPFNSLSRPTKLQKDSRRVTQILEQIWHILEEEAMVDMVHIGKKFPSIHSYAFSKSTLTAIHEMPMAEGANRLILSSMKCLFYLYKGRILS